MLEDIAEELGGHSLLQPGRPKFTPTETQRALIVWNQLGRRNNFIDVYRFYKAIEKSESVLTSRSRDASQKLDFDLMNSEPPTSTYLSENFLNLYPDKRDFMLPAELKDFPYMTSHAPNLKQALASQSNINSNVTATGVNIANNTPSANEDVIFVSQMMRDYCIAHKTTLKEFILEFKAYADKYGVNATVSNVAFYMQYITAVEQRGLPFNGIVNQNIPVHMPKSVTQTPAQSIDVMEIFDNAVKNINNYGNSDYYQNLMTAYNYNGMEVQQTFNGVNAANHENGKQKCINDSKQNGSADYSAILKRNIAKLDETNDNSNNKQGKVNDLANNGKSETKSTVAETISRNGNQMTVAQSTNNVGNSSYDDINDVWNQLSSVTIDPNTSFNLNNSRSSIQSSEIRTIERTPEKSADYLEEFNVTPSKMSSQLKNKSEKVTKTVLYKGNGIAASPKKVNKEGVVAKGIDDSNHSSFYLDAESSFSCPDSSIEEFERFKLRSSTSYQERLSDYHHTPVHDQHLHYSYEAPPVHVHTHAHAASPKHHHGGGGKKTNAAMSALTLLAFLFFLNILQQCLREQSQQFNNPPITIMTAREEYDQLAKTADSKKIDKTGRNSAEKLLINKKHAIEELAEHFHENGESDEKYSAKNPFTKIETVETKPKKNMYDNNQKQHKIRSPYSRNATIFREFIKQSYN